MTRTLLPALGRFTPPLPGLTDNVYSGYEPYIADHSAFVERFGDHETPLRKAIRATVQWHRAGARAARPTAA